MDNVKNDFYYVKRLLRSIEITSRYLKDKSIVMTTHVETICALSFKGQILYEDKK